MTFRRLSTQELSETVALSLGLNHNAPKLAIAKAVLRRATSLLAPATRNQVLRFARDPLEAFEISAEDLDNALEELITFGDVLEMGRLPDEPWGTPDIVLRPAPPTFVKRANGDFIIVGIAGDHPSPLTQVLQDRLADDGRIRRLKALPDEDLGAHLQLLGLLPLSEQTWLRAPAVETAAEHLARWKAVLESAGPSSTTIEGLSILDPSRDVHFYNGRWHEADNRTSGAFVARRPKAYGAALWSFVDLDAGAVRKIIDLHDGGDRQTPHDLAWRLQMAIDAERGVHQAYRITRGEHQVAIELFSPLPAFAERRLALIGERVKASRGALLGYSIPASVATIEISQLRALLWMTEYSRGQ